MMLALVCIEFLALSTFGLVVVTMGGDCDGQRCDWLAWDSWTDCSRTCGGGTRYRSRPLCCQSSLTLDQCLESCSLTRAGFGEYDDCNNICYNEASYSSGSCQCRDAYYGSCCSEEIQCGTPPSIANGVFSGDNYNYGGEITYSCNDQYILIRGDTKLTCRKYWWNNSGYWDGDVPYCAYIGSCSSDPCQNGATCANGYDVYNCTCLEGWTGSNCEFDIQPPLYSGCPENVTYFSAEPKYYANWTMPEFWDPFGNDVVVSSNYPSTEILLPWGEHVVQFVADKISNGFKAECLFSISVHTHPCKSLHPPQNGAFACNGWNKHYTEVCFLLCQDGHDVPLGINIRDPFVCGASGNWIPFNVNVSCSEMIPKGSIGNPHAYNSSCSNATEIREKYIQLLTVSDFSDLCLSDEWTDACETENVNVIC